MLLTDYITHKNAFWYQRLVELKGRVVYDAFVRHKQNKAIAVHKTI